MKASLLFWACLYLSEKPAAQVTDGKGTVIKRTISIPDLTIFLTDPTNY
jgi:hypothetical protein